MHGEQFVRTSYDRFGTGDQGVGTSNSGRGAQRPPLPLTSAGRTDREMARPHGWCTAGRMHRCATGSRALARV